MSVWTERAAMYRERMRFEYAYMLYQAASSRRGRVPMSREGIYEEARRTEKSACAVLVAQIAGKPA